MTVLSREDVLETLRKEFRAMKKGALTAPWREDAHFKHDLELDSLDIVEFVARAEMRYRVHVPDEEFARLDTLGKVIDYVLARQENLTV